jgi:hypothetical protein
VQGPEFNPVPPKKKKEKKRKKNQTHAAGTIQL